MMRQAQIVGGIGVGVALPMGLPHSSWMLLAAVGLGEAGGLLARLLRTSGGGSDPVPGPAAEAAMRRVDVPVMSVEGAVQAASRLALKATVA